MIYAPCVEPEPSVKVLGTLADKTEAQGPKPYKFIGSGEAQSPKTYNFMRLGEAQGPKPYKFIVFGETKVHFGR